MSKILNKTLKKTPQPTHSPNPSVEDCAKILSEDDLPAPAI